MPIRPTLTILASLLAGLLAAPLAAQAAADEKLLAAARAAQPAVVESLKAMVAIESGTMDAPGLGRIIDYAEARLKALGLQVERSPSGTGKSEVLVARASGSGRRKLMLIAHLDTIPL